MIGCSFQSIWLIKNALLNIYKNHLLQRMMFCSTNLGDWLIVNALMNMLLNCNTNFYYNIYFPKIVLVFHHVIFLFWYVCLIYQFCLEFTNLCVTFVLLKSILLVLLWIMIKTICITKQQYWPIIDMWICCYCRNWLGVEECAGKILAK